ncbi:MAG TPA: hypothetical protein VI542_36155 [Candidatus Tectomicrobia bacterium]
MMSIIKYQKIFNNLITLLFPILMILVLSIIQRTTLIHSKNKEYGSNTRNRDDIVVTVDSRIIYQTIEGFGTCLSGNEAEQNWWQQLYYDDMRSSILRVDLTPRFVSPYHDFSYNSPWFHNNPSLPGPENNNVRTYTSPNDYSRTFAGRSAPIAVMKADATQNLTLFDYNHVSPRVGGVAAQAGQSRKSQLGDFKLIGSIWSPPPWVKISSGNTYGGSSWPLPVGGTRYPFIWADNFVGGKLDISNAPLSVFHDGTQNTSSLTQFARATASYILGYQRAFNVRFYAISIQNELNFETFYNSMTYPQSHEYITALKTIHAEFNKYDELRNIKIMGPEDLLGGDAYGMWKYGGSTHKNLQYIRNIQNDPQAAAIMEFFSIHGYANDGVNSSGAVPTQWDWWVNGWTSSPAPGIPPNVQGIRTFGKKSWMTETSGEATSWLSPTSGFPGNGAWSIALKIHQALTTGQESAWIYWQLTDGKNVADQTLTDNTLRANSPKYVALKHFARYIRPNSIRVAADVSGSTLLNASAYIHSVNKTLTTVLVNSSPINQTVTVELQGFPSSIAQLNSYTSSNNNLWQASTINVTNNTATVTVPGYGVTTLYGVSNAG